MSVPIPAPGTTVIVAGTVYTVCRIVTPEDHARAGLSNLARHECQAGKLADVCMHRPRGHTCYTTTLWPRGLDTRRPLSMGRCNADCPALEG